MGAVDFWSRGRRDAGRRHELRRYRKSLVGCSPCRAARARRRSELGNRGRLRHGQLSSPWRSGRRFANFQRQRGPAGPPESVFGENTPRITYLICVFRHLQRVPHASPSPRLSRLPRSLILEGNAACASRACPMGDRARSATEQRWITRTRYQGTQNRNLLDKKRVGVFTSPSVTR